MKETLLDTHMLLWATLDSSKLSKQAIELIDDPENQIYINSDRKPLSLQLNE